MEIIYLFDVYYWDETCTHIYIVRYTTCSWRNHLKDLNGRDEDDVKCSGFTWICWCCTNMSVVSCCWIDCQKKTWSTRRGFNWGMGQRSSAGSCAVEAENVGLTLVLSCESECFPARSALVSSWQEFDSGWVRRWALKLQAKAKHFPHRKQVCGFFPINQTVNKGQKENKNYKNLTSM